MTLQQQQAANRKRQRRMGAANSQHSRSYLDEWRKRVDDELETSANAHQQAALIQERILGRLDDHDRRIKALEVSPEGLRSSLGTYGGCIGQAIFALLSTAGVIISLVSVAVVILKH